MKKTAISDLEQISSDTAIQIPLWGRDGQILGWAIIDSSDAPEIAPHRWCKSFHGYVVRRTNKENGLKLVRLHRVLIQPSKSELVDHIDGNPLNNRRSNLRICTSAENSRNARISKNNVSGYKGVSWAKRCQKYRASIGVDHKQIHLGLFSNPEDAAEAYNRAALLHHGEFASLNIINLQVSV